MGSFGDFISGGAGSIIGTVAGYFGAKKDREFAGDQANANMGFQERMSNTSHQREVADLEKAGLNPLLSANAGASAGTGAQAQANSIMGEAMTAAAEAQSIQLAMEKQEAEIGLINNQSKKTSKEADIMGPAAAIAADGKKMYNKLMTGAEKFGSDATDAITGWQGYRAQKQAEQEQKHKIQRIKKEQQNRRKVLRRRPGT